MPVHLAGMAALLCCCSHSVLTLKAGEREELWWRSQEATKLWCLCKLPYNEDRPMLACDYCQDWFHYDCVGLRAPSDDEDDADVAPEDYRCPNCCAKVAPAHHCL